MAGEDIDIEAGYFQKNGSEAQDICDRALYEAQEPNSQAPLSSQVPKSFIFDLNGSGNYPVPDRYSRTSGKKEATHAPENLKKNNKELDEQASNIFNYIGWGFVGIGLLGILYTLMSTQVDKSDLITRIIEQ